MGIEHYIPERVGQMLITGISSLLKPVAKAARAPRHPTSYAAMLRHLGGPGLLLVAIVDSSPLPTFGGTDILTAIFAARHTEPWYYYALMATAGSVIGAYLTFRAARLAGSDYLRKKFGKRRVATFLDYFERWGTTGLAVSTAVPLPFPTSSLFAAGGVLNYPRRRFLLVVSVCRAIRYAVIALVAFHYGRHFIRVLRHPGQYMGWFILIVVAVAALIAAAIVIRRRLQLAAGAEMAKSHRLAVDSRSS
jgi:membrane protein YqaA with SNARE-associated domain